MLFEDVIKESNFNDSFEDLGVFRTKSIQAISKHSLLERTAHQSMAHLQVTDEADQREIEKLNVEAWE